MRMTINHDGGAKLQIVLKDLGRKIQSAYAHVGTFDPEAAKYGATNEYGDPGHNVPARPFMHTTFQQRRQEWLSLIIDKLKKGGASSRQIVQEVGNQVAGNIVETLDNAPTLFAANAPYTVKKKGFDYPLKETGRLRKTIKCRVTGGPL